MPEATIVLEVEDPNFTIMLYEDILKIDLKGSLKNELEEALENKPVLKDTIGKVLGIFVPLHIRISEIRFSAYGRDRKNQGKPRSSPGYCHSV